MRSLAQILVLTFAAGASLAQKPPSPADIVAAFGLKDYRVSYRDEAGRPLSAAQFEAQAKEGKSLSVVKDEGRKTAVLSLAPQPGVLRETPQLAVKVGEAMPSLSGTLIDGKPATLAAGGERYTLLAFFFERCAPCINEIPDLNHINAALPDVRVVSVTFDAVETTRRLIARHGIRYTTLSGAKASIDALRVQGFPKLLLVKPDGTLAAIRTGGGLASNAETKAQLEAWVRQVMSGSASKG